MTDQTASPRIEWRVEFETGNAGIDHEHKEMINRINSLLDACAQEAEADTVLAQLGHVLAWISAHFAFEEKVMRDHGYDHYEIHKYDHENLLDDLRDLMDEIESNGYGGSEGKIQQRISDWFVIHFKTQDARLHSTLGQ